MSPPDRLIDALREVERSQDLTPSHFRELAQAVVRMAQQDPLRDLPDAANLNRGMNLAAMTPPDLLIAALRKVDAEDALPAPHFEELTQTVLRIIRREGRPGHPESEILRLGADLASSHPADRLIRTLREVAAKNDLPSPHFEELVHTILRMAPATPEHEAILAAELGGRQISEGQNAIVKNLARTVIGPSRFLVVDVGALDGWFIDRILSESRDIHLIAFEPMPDMIPELDKRRELWPTIEIFHVAVGEGPDTLPLRVYPKIPGLSSLLDFEPGYQYFKGQFDATEFHTVEVPVVSLDDHFRAHPELAQYDNIAIKIDVQGFEDRVLRGARDLLASGRVKAVLIELVTRPKYAGSWDYLTLLRHLESSGFVLYDVNPFYREIGMEFQATGLGRLTEMDCLFVRLDYVPATYAPG